MLKTNKEYNFKLNQEPNNVELWIQFIDAQLKMVDNFNLNLAEKKELNDRKLSIMEKALSLNPGNVVLQIKELQLIHERLSDDYYRVILKKAWSVIEAHP